MPFPVLCNSFLAEGGDGYNAFRDGTLTKRDAVSSDVLADHIMRVNTVSPPELGRLTDASSPR